MILRKLGETASTETIGWDPVPGAAGYRFTVDAQERRPHTWDPLFQRDKAYPACNTRIPKGAALLVEALRVSESGAYPMLGPWPGWSHEISGVRLSAPDRHFLYAGGAVRLTCYPDTPKLGTDRQLVSAYLPNGQALAVPGADVEYETTIRYAEGFEWTTGQLNWNVEWHTANGQLSCAVGVATDYPVVMGQPGRDPRFYFRPTGPSGERNIFGPSAVAGCDYRLRVRILWGANGRFRAWLDDSLVCDELLATLWPGDQPGFGLYHYRLAAPWEASVAFSEPTMRAA